jgi:hypothetical protein
VNPETKLWLWTLLALAGGALGLWLHFRLHPLRAEMALARDRLRALGWVVLALAACEWLGGGHAAWAADARGDSLLAQSREALLTLGRAFQGIFRAWPAGVAAMPLALILAAAHIVREPHRAGYTAPPPRAVPVSILVLLALAFAWWVNWWGKPPQPDPLHLKIALGARFALEVVAAAMAQVWLAAVLAAGDSPGRAWWRVLGAWRGVLWLAAFHALWLALRSRQTSGGGWLVWLEMEMLLIFGPLPLAVVVAGAGGGPASLAGTAASMLAQGWRQYLGLLASWTVVLALLLLPRRDIRDALQGHETALKVVEAIFILALALTLVWMIAATWLALLLPRRRKSGGAPARAAPKKKP